MGKSGEKVILGACQEAEEEKEKLKWPNQVWLSVLKGPGFDFDQRHVPRLQS